MSFLVTVIAALEQHNLTLSNNQSVAYISFNVGFMIDQPVDGAPLCLLLKRNCSPHRYTSEVTTSPRVIAFQMDFTPEANKRMNPTLILLAAV